MSTIASTNIKHPSSATNNITLASTGAVAVNGSMTGAGLDLITPTSIAYSGGTASASGGQVTFNSVTSVSLNGIFSSSYQNYRIMIVLSGASTYMGIALRTRASGADNGSDYYVQYHYASGTTNTASRSATTYASVGYTGTSSLSVTDIANPNVAAPTKFIAISNGSDSTDVSPFFYNFASIQNNSSIFDGITLLGLTGGATFSGIIRAYGYKNS